MDIWENWLVIAFMAPFLWALVNVIDVYFVESVYEDEYDGAMISGLFQIVPWALVPFGLLTFVMPGWEVMTLAVIGGGCFLLSWFYYFRTLFSSNDVATAQVLYNLGILMVPFLAWILIGERLDLVHYAGIGIAFIGATLLSFDHKVRSRSFPTVARYMVVSAFFFSLSMVLEEKAYALAADFWSVFLLFSLGAAVTGIALSLVDAKRSVERLRHIGRLSRRYFLVFMLAEGMAFGGALTSQRAIDLSPSPSFVAVIESLIPAFVIAISFILSLVFLRMNRELARKLYQDQLSGLPVKMISIVVIACSIYLIS